MQVHGRLQAGMHAVCATVRLFRSDSRKELRRKLKDSLATARGGYVT